MLDRAVAGRLDQRQVADQCRRSALWETMMTWCGVSFAGQRTRRTGTPLRVSGPQPRPR